MSESTFLFLHTILIDIHSRTGILQTKGPETVNGELHKIETFDTLWDAIFGDR